MKRRFFPSPFSFRSAIPSLEGAMREAERFPNHGGARIVDSIIGGLKLDPGASDIIRRIIRQTLDEEAVLRMVWDGQDRAEAERMVAADRVVLESIRDGSFVGSKGLIAEACATLATDRPWLQSSAVSRSHALRRTLSRTALPFALAAFAAACLLGFRLWGRNG